MGRIVTRILPLAGVCDLRDAVLFLNLYLEKYHGETASVHEDFEVLLLSFSEKFEISKREREVIQLICKGLSNQEISDALFISLQTVKDHIHHIFVKTGVKNRSSLPTSSVPNKTYIAQRVDSPSRSNRISMTPGHMGSFISDSHFPNICLNSMIFSG